jgi:hypothetical protein
VVADAPATLDHLGAAAAVHFDAVRTGLERREIPYEIAPRLVRGLDYYNRTVFEYQARSYTAAQDALGGGGRYDPLAELLGGPPTPGVGLAMGVDRIVAAMPEGSESEGRGVLLITAHIGSTAAGVIALSLKGYPVQLLLHDSPSDTSVPAALRAYSRLKIRWMRDKSLRDPVLMDLASGPGDKGQALLKGSRVLRRNGILIVAIDVPPHLIGNRQPVTFLGRDCLFPAGFLQLAYLTGSPIVPYFPRREGDNWNHQSISVGPPVPLTRDLQTDLQSCVDRLEARIRLSPEQWLSWDSASHFLAPEPP